MKNYIIEGIHANTLFFRGQTKKIGEKISMPDKTPLRGSWIYGGVLQGTGKRSVIIDYDTGEKFSVYTDTLCPYIGIRDIRGKRIFTGDIVKHFTVQKDPSKYDVGIIFYDGTKCKYCRTSTDGELYEIWSDNHYEVLGNVFDNPDMADILIGDTDNCFINQKKTEDDRESVIHCYNCRFKETVKDQYGRKNIVCARQMIMPKVQPTDYCSYGQR